MILVDTSVWVHTFKHGRAAFDAAVDIDDVVTCLPVIQEVLQGFDDQAAYLKARRAMLALPIVESPLASDVFDDAVDLYRVGRRAGVTVGSGIDCLIAACALRHSLPVLHDGRDYDELARISPLQARRLRHSPRS